MQHADTHQLSVQLSPSLQARDNMLDRFRAVAATEEDAVVVRTRVWDETGQRIAHQVKHIMVLRQTLGLSSSRRGIEMAPVLLAPYQLESTRAVDIMAALDKVPAPCSMRQLAALRPGGAIVLSVDTLDAAAANASVARAEALTATELGTAYATMWCNAHQVHLGCGNAMTQGLSNALSSLFSGALLCRMGLWGVMQQCLPTLAQRLAVQPGPTLPPLQEPTRASEHARMIMRLCVPQGASACRRKSADRLIAVLNGNWTQDTMVHRCGDNVTGPCCATYQDSVQKATQALKDCIFKAQPTVPIRARWTKCLPCVQAVLLGVAVHRVLPQTLSLAAERKRLVPASASSSAEQGAVAEAEAAAAAVQAEQAGQAGQANRADAAEALLPAAPADEEPGFEVLRACRLQRFMSFLRQTTCLSQLTIYAAVLGPAQQLIAHLLKAGATKRLREAAQAPNQAPALLRWPLAVQRAQGQLAQLLQFDARPVSLAYLLAEQRARMNDEQAWRSIWALARKQVLISASEQHSRLLVPATQWPWKLATVLDFKHPMEQAKVVEETISLSPCCLGPFVWYPALAAEQPYFQQSERHYSNFKFGPCPCCF